MDRDNSAVDSWEVQTRERIQRAENRIQEIQEEAGKQIASLQNLKKALEEALRLYREVMGLPLAQAPQGLTPKDIDKRSYRQLLRLIASRNGGVLVVSQAIEMMKEAGVFANPLNASQSIYSIIQRNKSEFIKIEPGKYRLANTPERAKPARQGTTSGLQQAIKALKTSDPSLTKDQVRDRLIQDKFDFHGKNMSSAVNMAWMRLGYGKQNQGQRRLLELPTN